MTSEDIKRAEHAIQWGIFSIVTLFLFMLATL